MTSEELNEFVYSDKGRLTAYLVAAICLAFLPTIVLVAHPQPATWFKIACAIWYIVTNGGLLFCYFDPEKRWD